MLRILSLILFFMGGWYIADGNLAATVLCFAVGSFGMIVNLYSEYKNSR